MTARTVSSSLEFPCQETEIAPEQETEIAPEPWGIAEGDTPEDGPMDVVLQNYKNPHYLLHTLGEENGPPDLVLN